MNSLVDGDVGFAEILSSFAVTDYDIFCTDRLEHIGGDLAGERAGFLPVDVLGADLYGAALGCRNGVDKVNVRHTGDDFALIGLLSGNLRLDGVDQLGRFGGSLVHLPVAGDDRSSELCIH